MRISCGSILCGLAAAFFVCNANEGLADNDRLHGNDVSASLHKLIDAEWERTLREDPPFASRLGDRRYNNLWPDLSPEAIEASAAATRDALATVRAIDVEKLDAADQLNWRLFEREYSAYVNEQKYKLHQLTLNQRGGIQDLNNLSRSLSFESERDYRDWVDRMHALPLYMDQTIAVMRRGMASGILHPKVVMKRIPAQIRKQLVEQPTASPYYEPFKTIVVEMSASRKKELRDAATSAIVEKVLPSYERFLDFFEREYLPASYDKVGCWQRPDGQRMYADLAMKYTTTDMSPQQIHDVGLKEVARIRAEMESVQEQVGFKGSFQEFLVHLRSDPQFYYKDPNKLLAAYRECCDRIEPALPRLFRRLPKIPFEITAIPDQIAPDTTTAYYQRPAADGSRPGRYFVNLYRPQDRPKFEIEALSLHESIPGHHFQIALSIELENVPEFRRYGGYTAFIEGWGLYSEKLGEELGMYKDPYSKFGQLTYEMWRAIRLVVDTGMHSLKWSRQDAIDVFTTNTAKPMLDIENEVDRYIAWPGQALAYKIGELRIRELRARAESKLGDAFDVRDFHEVVLKDGAVPLSILERNVDAWLAESER